MTKIIEVFGYPTTSSPELGWDDVVSSQSCPYTGHSCTKIRKSQPEISIGTCSVLHGRMNRPVLICPNRLLEQGQVFTDCLHLLSLHEPGNRLHLIPEIKMPGGSVDYFLASVRSGHVQDFVGIELQTLDTTGTVWPERQRFLQSVGIEVEVPDKKPFGMNWKMTAKTTLVQLHHKAESFEMLNKRLVIVMQDELLEYLRQEFQFNHMRGARLGDTVQFHAYAVSVREHSVELSLSERISTDSDGIATSLGLQAEARVELQDVIEQIQAKLSSSNIFIPH